MGKLLRTWLVFEKDGEEFPGDFFDAFREFCWHFLAINFQTLLMTVCSLWKYGSMACAVFKPRGL